MKRLWALPDLQVPYHDMRAIDAITAALEVLREPEDRTLQAGDSIDFQTISRWSAGTPTEYEGSIGKDRDKNAAVLKQLGITDMVRSNHTDRLWMYVMRKAPGLIGAPEFDLVNFLRLPELGITYHEKAWECAPGWLAMHGDESGASQEAGKTAQGISRKVGMSVICGHSHRLGMQPFTYGVNGRITRTLFGVECGHLMDTKKALYSKTHNWQQGFAVLHIEDGKVHPELVPIVNRSFVVMGERFTF